MSPNSLWNLDAALLKAGAWRFVDWRESLTLPSMKALLEAPALDIEGARVPVRLTINRRARRLIVRVAKAGSEIVVVAPSRRELKDALDFAERQKSWIAARLDEQPPRVDFRPGERIPIHGRLYTIEHRPEVRGGVWIEERHEPMLCVSGDATHSPRRIEEYLKRQARAHLTERTRAHCEALGVPAPRISIRDPMTRWGSCSHASGISYSWRLVMAPDWIADYVAAHECAHLVHMNHSKAFWRLLGTLVLDVRAAVRWLASDGRELHRYGG